jgi:glycosyltransferase involved in cell wall biosynthesis
LEGLKTFKVLIKYKPSIIFVSVPPIFAALVVYAYNLIYKAEFIIDSHTGALDGMWKNFIFLHKFLSKRALTTIVTNEHLAEIFTGWDTNTLVLGDIVMSFPKITKINLSKKFNLVNINTFSSDEPLEKILEAASKLPQVEFYITGNLMHDYQGLHKKYPHKNVTFTDFLPDYEYLQLVKSADAAMIFTKMNYTMQRGAYEAMSLGTPIIISNWPILRETFYKGAIYVENEEESIRKGILAMVKNKRTLDDKILELKKERIKIFNAKIDSLRTLISSHTAT